MVKAYDWDEDCVILVDEITAESAKAYQIRAGEVSCWLPKSEVDCAGNKGDENVTISVPFWLVERNGLEDFIQD